MSNELMLKEVQFEVNGELVKLTGNTVKNYLTRGNEVVSDQEVVMFINLCKYKKLNPFLNEAYLVKFKGAPAQIIVGKEAFMKKAETNPNFDGMEAGLIVQSGDEILEIEGSFMSPKDKLLGGWAKVYRKDRHFPYVSKVSLQEYSKGQSTWKNIPSTMIRKTAIVQAMREAFPVELGSMYTEEEQTNKSLTMTEAVEVEIEQNANTETLDIPKESQPIIEAEIIQEKEIEPAVMAGPDF